ncbi:unnamed protein product [Moneuplotes crassus]|uniref:Uncharacterized protein n=1 Tax=Euplotes crassus TaxID=5936 RepID=A0AAD1XC37_EUPCR|nr:unnamed protein product [Moneuplotes crassus]
MYVYVDTLARGFFNLGAELEHLHQYTQCIRAYNEALKLTKINKKNKQQIGDGSVKKELGFLKYLKKSILSVQAKKDQYENLQARRSKDKTKNKLTDILNYNPPLKRAKLVKRLKASRRPMIPSSKDDLGIQSMLHVFSKSKDKHKNKQRSSTSYNKSFIRSKASTAMRNRRSRQKYSNNMRNRLSTAKNKMNEYEYSSHHMTLKDVEYSLPKLHPGTTNYSRPRKTNYDSLCFKDKNDMIRNKNWVKRQTDQYKYLAEGGLIAEDAKEKKTQKHKKKLTRLKQSKMSKRASKVGKPKTDFDLLNFNFDKDWRNIHNLSRDTDNVLYDYDLNMSPTGHSMNKSSGRNCKSKKSKRSTYQKPTEMNADLNLELE